MFPQQTKRTLNLWGFGMRTAWESSKKLASGHRDLLVLRELEVGVWCNSCVS